MRVGIILFDGFDELDAIAPYEVFRQAAKLGADVVVELVTLARVEEVTAAGGLRVRPHGRLAGRPDLVVVPGGGWNDRDSPGAWIEVQRGQLTQLLRELHDAGTIIATVCTGGMVAASAGLTTGRPGTTHQTALEELRATGTQVVDARVVDDGDLIMAGGVTSGIDLALWVLEREVGGQVAAAVAREIEYERTADVWQGTPRNEPAGHRARRAPG